MARGKRDKANAFLTWLKKILIVAGAVVAYILSPLDLLPGKPYDDVIVGVIGVAAIVVMSILDIINGTDSTYEMVGQVRQTGSYYERKKLKAEFNEREKKREERYAANKREREERYAQNRAYQAKKDKRFEDMKRMEANKQQRFEYYKAKEGRKAAEQAERDKMSSFDTDDFFEAAVKRSNEHISKRARGEK